MKKNNTQNPKPPTLQDLFLNQIISAQAPVSMYLVNGIRLIGALVSHDRYTVLIQNKVGGSNQLIYKAAISTVLPDARPVKKDGANN